jgi:hypothetical protein
VTMMQDLQLLKTVIIHLLTKQMLMTEILEF